MTKILTLHLSIDGRRQRDIPMLILDLGSHDIILGRKWFTHFDIWLDVRNQRLLWPRTHPSTPTFAREICMPRENLQTTEPNPIYQADIVKRDLAFAKEDKRRTDGRRLKTILAKAEPDRGDGHVMQLLPDRKSVV